MGAGHSNAEGFTEDVFFYHSDHLGSTSYVTDGDGNATLFVAYYQVLMEGRALQKTH